jgi:hypothetical protein
MSNSVTTAQPDVGAEPWPLGVRIGASVVLAFHLLAVGLHPFTVQPASRLATDAFRVPLLRQYVSLLYLDHGYKFFAPNPGVHARSIAYRLEFEDGHVEEGIFPDVNKHQPRLLYHRYFMLAEHLLPAAPREPTAYDRYINEMTAAEPRDPFVKPSGEVYTLVSGLHREVLGSYANHLLAESGAKRVTLVEQLWLVPWLEHARDGLKLTDPMLKERRWLGTMTRTPEGLLFDTGMLMEPEIVVPLPAPASEDVAS